MAVIKFSLLAANLIIFALGVAALVNGILSLTNQALIIHLTWVSTYASISYITLTGGIVMMIISFLGLYGILKDNTTILYLYIILLMLAFIMVLTSVIMEFKNRSSIEENLYKDMVESVKAYPERRSKEYWDAIQPRFECCGFAYNSVTPSVAVWVILNPKEFNIRVPVPDSCCKSGESIHKCRTSPWSIYSRDCYVEVKNSLLGSSIPVIAIGILILLIVILGIVLSWSHVKAVSKAQRIQKIRMEN